MCPTSRRPDATTSDLYEAKRDLQGSPTASFSEEKFVSIRQDRGLAEDKLFEDAFGVIEIRV